MPIRNRITKATGYTSVPIKDGFDELVVDTNIVFTQPPKISTSSGTLVGTQAAATTINITEPFTVIPLYVTATLPTLANHLVGQRFILALTQSAPNGAANPAATTGSILASAGGQLINGSGTTRLLLAAKSGSTPQTSGSTANNLVWCWAVKTPMNTFGWLVASCSAL